MFVPRDASSHVARNACSHVCGTDRDGEPLGQMPGHARGFVARTLPVGATEGAVATDSA
jgi:hypothetical protein